MRYQKKPVVIDAWQTDPSLPNLGLPANIHAGVSMEHGKYFVYDELHDTPVKFEAGDWIIKGLKGEFYPCKPDVFEASYEPAQKAWQGQNIMD